MDPLLGDATRLFKGRLNCHGPRALLAWPHVLSILAETFNMGNSAARV
jgi:hypothetical protein